MSKVMMYARFERLWHWSQAVLVILMLVTGLYYSWQYQSNDF